MGNDHFVSFFNKIPNPSIPLGTFGNCTGASQTFVPVLDADQSCTTSLTPEDYLVNEAFDICPIKGNFECDCQFKTDGNQLSRVKGSESCDPTTCHPTCKKKTSDSVSMKLFVDRDSNTNMSHGLVSKSNLLNGIPDCVEDCKGRVQPEYLKSPSGKKCNCSWVTHKGKLKYFKAGYVYIWTTERYRNKIVKLGCNQDYKKGSENNCFHRIKYELLAQKNAFDLRIFCAKIDNSFEYLLNLKSKKGKKQTLEGCNAGEVSLQKHLYCKQKWNGQTRNNMNPLQRLPLEANPEDGFTEWYFISFDDAVKLFKERITGNKIVKYANIFTVTVKKNGKKFQNEKKFEVEPYTQFPEVLEFN